MSENLLGCLWRVDFVFESAESMAPCEYTQLSREDALAILPIRAPAFAAITRPEQLSFDSVAAVMSAAPGGFQRIMQDDTCELETFVIERVLPGLLARTQEVMVIPDCWMISRPPFRLTAGNVIRLLEQFERDEDGFRSGLFDGASDILFVFNSGDLLLIDHDERIWFSPGVEAGPCRAFFCGAEDGRRCHLEAA